MLDVSGGVWWLGFVIGFDFAEVSQFCFFLVSFSFLGEYVLLTYVGGIADAMLCEIELFSFLFFSFPNTFFLLQILFFFSKNFKVPLHPASPLQILGTAPGFGCKKTLKYPQK